jgi:hypothetical protein
VHFEILKLGDWEIAISQFPNPTFPNYSVLKLFISKQSGLRVTHSVRNDLTGFATAALSALKLIVAKAIITATITAMKNIHPLIFTRYA